MSDDGVVFSHGKIEMEEMSPAAAVKLSAADLRDALAAAEAREAQTKELATTGF